METKKPQLFLLFALTANALIFVLIAFLCRQLSMSSEQKLQFVLLSVFGFACTAASLYFVSRSLKQISESNEAARATLLSSISNQETEPARLIRLSIEEIAADLAKEVEELRQAERAIVDYSPELICSLNEKTEIVELNANAEKIWQHSNFSLLGMPFSKLALVADRAQVDQFLQDCKTGKEQKPLECRYLTASGKAMDISLQAEWSGSGNGFYCVGTDISAKKEIERLKAEINQMVSHDLRAPVSALSFFLEGLLGGDFGSLSESGKTQVLKLKDSLEQVLRLINQLLDAEKLEAGALKVELKVVPVSAFLETAISLLTPLAEKKKLILDFSEPDEFAFADFDRTVQVFSNLLSNAIKWSPESSTIRIKVSAEQEMVRIEVADQGPGIPVEHWNLIFERFKTADSSSTTASGSGLGLYISKTLVALQNGQMGVYSVPGKGASFWFTLKRATDADLPGYMDSADSTD